MSSEVELQSKILAWLREKGIWHRRLPVGAVRHGGIRKRSPLKGMPDILGVLPFSQGRMFCIEVKTLTSLSKAQEEVISELEGEGVLVIVARSLRDVSDLLENPRSA